MGSRAASLRLLVTRMPGLAFRHFRKCLSCGAIGALILVATSRAGTEIARDQAVESPGASWKPGQLMPIAVERGRARFEIPTASPGARTLVIVSALSKESGPFAIRLSARSASEPRAQAPMLIADGPRLAPSVPNTPLPPLPPPSRTLPPRERTFHLMVRDGDVASASNYVAVRGALRAVGERVQVYVDRRDVQAVGPEVLRDVMATFDERVFSVSARTIGQARDVDADGRFTVLMSSWLTRLAGGKHAVDGFVRGADLDPGMAAPFSNHCDMMYLSTALTAGPYLRTVLAHEYTHAVTVTAKALNGTTGARTNLDEEGWLDEAIAHLTEDLHGFSRSNIDYRVSAFLSCPERYRLVVEDYYAAGLFRSHGSRGCTYLFLRWCADRFGPGLLPSLVRSEHRGEANLEAATGVPFADLYRQWSAALYLSGLAPTLGDGLRYQSLEVRGPFDDWELAGPRATELAPDAAADQWSALGTSSHFVVVGSSPTGTVSVEVNGPPEAELQVTAVALPPGMARLNLSARLAHASDGSPRLLAELRESHGTAVRLSALAWEPLVPATDRHTAETRRGALDMLGIAASFGTSALPARGQLASRPIPLPNVPPDVGPFLVKAIGTDANGHRVAAWATLALPHAPETGDDDRLVP